MGVRLRVGTHACQIVGLERQEIRFCGILWLRQMLGVAPAAWSCRFVLARRPLTRLHEHSAAAREYQEGVALL